MALLPEGLRPWLVALHIVFYSLYLGGWFMAMVWKSAADRREDPGEVARWHRVLARAETRVVVPLGFLGFFLGYLPRRLIDGPRITADAWTTYGMLLWFAGLAAWWFGMRKVEDRLIVTAEDAAGTDEGLGERYARASLLWFALATLALLLPTAGVFVMVFKVDWGASLLWMVLWVLFTLGMAIFGWLYPVADAGAEDASDMA